MKSSMKAFESKIKQLLSEAPSHEAYETLNDFKESIQAGWILCDQYHEDKSKILVETLEKLSLYVSHNGDTWVKERATEALKKYRGEA
jgi:hypothetical protein